MWSSGKKLSWKTSVLPYVLQFFPPLRLRQRDREHRETIQQLCSQVAATHGDEELHRLCMELRSSLNDHIRQLRKHVEDTATP